MGMRELTDMATDTTIAAVANKVTVVGGGAAFLLGGLTVNELAALGGLGVAIVSMLIQSFYKWRANKRIAAADARQQLADEAAALAAARREAREAEEHVARMAVLRKQEAGNV